MCNCLRTVSTTRHRRNTLSHGCRNVYEIPPTAKNCFGIRRWEMIGRCVECGGEWATIFKHRCTISSDAPQQNWGLCDRKRVVSVAATAAAAEFAVCICNRGRWCSYATVNQRAPGWDRWQWNNALEFAFTPQCVELHSNCCIFTTNEANRHVISIGEGFFCM